MDSANKTYVVAWYMCFGPGKHYTRFKMVQGEEAAMQALKSVVEKELVEHKNQKLEWVFQKGTKGEVAFGYYETYFGHCVYAVENTGDEFACFDSYNEVDW